MEKHLPPLVTMSYRGQTPVPLDSREDLLKFLSVLEKDADGFAIMSRDSYVYIQANTLMRGGFCLEYQNGTPEAHYERVGEDGTHKVTFEVVKKAFLAYFDGDDTELCDTRLWLDMELAKSDRKVETHVIETRMASTAATTPVTFATIQDGLHSVHDR